MIPLLVLGTLIGLPILLSLLFRINVGFLYLSILAGVVLVRFLSDDVAFAIGAFVPSASVPLVSQLTVLVAPVIVTILILRKSVPSSKIALHLLPIVSCGLLFAVLAVPILPSPLQADIFATQLGDSIRKSQDLIVGGSTILVLLTVWQGFYHKKDKLAKHSKH